MKSNFNKATALILLSLTVIGLLSGCQQSKLDTPRLKVMTFNIRYNNPGDGINAWPNRKAEVVSMIKFYDADIVGNQEVLKEQKEYLDQALIDYKSVGIGRADGIDKGEFSALYYKESLFEMLDNGTFWLSTTPDIVASVGWDASMERISTWAKLKEKKSGKIFFAFNTHFDHIGQEARVHSAELILKKIDELAGDSPVILTGDFNVTDDNEAYKIITRGGLFDAQFKSALPHHGPTWTFHGFETVELKDRGKIDYIFVNGKVKVLKHAVLSDKFDRGYPSDHLPVFAVIELK